MRKTLASNRIRSLGSCLAVALLFSAVAVHASDSLDLERFRGKVVVVDFWASWCEPCRHSFPWLNEMQAKYADRGLVIIGVNVDRERADAERFLREVPAGFPIVYDPTARLPRDTTCPACPVPTSSGRPANSSRGTSDFAMPRAPSARAELEGAAQSMRLHA